MSLQLERTVCNDHLDLKISGDNNNDGDHAHGLLSCVIVCGRQVEPAILTSSLLLRMRRM